jgi:hypothetical protein
MPQWAPGLLGDKSHSVVFDNRKVQQLAAGWHPTIPFARGAREIMAWYDADPARRHIDDKVNVALDALLARVG